MRQKLVLLIYSRFVSANRLVRTPIVKVDRPATCAKHMKIKKIMDSNYKSGKAPSAPNKKLIERYREHLLKDRGLDLQRVSSFDRQMVAWRIFSVPSLDAKVGRTWHVVGDEWDVFDQRRVGLCTSNLLYWDAARQSVRTTRRWYHLPLRGVEQQISDEAWSWMSFYLERNESCVDDVIVVPADQIDDFLCHGLPSLSGQVSS